MRLSDSSGAAGTLLGMTVVLAACGASSPATVSVPAHAAPLTSRAPARVSHRIGTPAPPLGTPERVDTAGSILTVDVTGVLDPLTDAGAGLLPGTRAVGVLLRVLNAGPEIYDSSATEDVSLAPASDSSTPVFAARGVCRTRRRDFENYITPGEDRSGCVAFALADSTPVRTVRFSPHAQRQGRLSWRVGG